MKSPTGILASALILTSLVGASPSLAEMVLLPGALKGAGTMGPTGVHRLCSPLAIGLNAWKLEWVTRAVKPTAAQDVLLRELVAASEQVKDTIDAACNNGTGGTGIEQLAAMEARAGALKEALRIIGPVYGKFYASLDDSQKARLDGLGPARRGWRW
jgi:hypothetical protein